MITVIVVTRQSVRFCYQAITIRQSVGKELTVHARTPTCGPARGVNIRRTGTKRLVGWILTPPHPDRGTRPATPSAQRVPAPPPCREGCNRWQPMFSRPYKRIESLPTSKNHRLPSVAFRILCLSPRRPAHHPPAGQLSPPSASASTSSTRGAPTRGRTPLQPLTTRPPARPIR